MPQRNQPELEARRGAQKLTFTEVRPEETLQEAILRAVDHLLSFYNPSGWKAPCYLITDGHHATFEDFLEKTKWDQYGRGRDPRCEHCMVHVGYEPSAVLGANRRLRDTWRLLQWQLSGVTNGHSKTYSPETDPCSPLLPAPTDSSEVT